MNANTETTNDSIERGPNGIPYIDAEQSHVSQWENGEYMLRVVREDGEVVNVNLSESMFEAFQKSIGSIDVSGKDGCPQCGESEGFYPNGAAYWCENCELEFTLDGDTWWSYDATGEMNRVTENSTEEDA